jgi:hypothetical protein
VDTTIADPRATLFAVLDRHRFVLGAVQSAAIGGINRQRLNLARYLKANGVLE